MYVDDPMVLELVALLKAHGVTRVVISPGSRHYPIVRSLEADSDFDLYSVVDERSAAFFGIGLIRATGEPSAVLTTSGTAAVNLASAMADAYYQRLPLVAITADRLPQLLDQMEDQMVDQTELFAGTIRARGLLRPIESDVDHWYNNRVINEVLLAMRVNGVGPVHINAPIAGHTGLKYDVAELPAARVISHHTPSAWATDWSGVSSRLRGKRVMLLWGQSDPPDEQLLQALDFFTSRTDSIVISDHLGNLHTRNSLPNAFLTLRSGSVRRGALTPDVVISMGGALFLIDEVKAVLRRGEVEHWRVDPDGQVVDPFGQLTDIFQVAPLDFLRNAVAVEEPVASANYLSEGIEIAQSLPAPDSAYGELSVIGKFLERLPQGVALHVANSAPMRMAHLYPIDTTVLVLGNRGVNGIDGTMSATIGYAAASQRPTFLVIGDLSFFYDMNSLGIRHFPPTLRILLINNGGGALMHAAPVPPSLSDQASRHTSAGHVNSARGWVESLGLGYRSARDQGEFEDSLGWFFEQTRQGPRVFEVFTEKSQDMRQLMDYYTVNASTGQSGYRKVRALAGKTLRRMGLRG